MVYCVIYAMIVDLQCIVCIVRRNMYITFWCYMCLYMYMYTYNVYILWLYILTGEDARPSAVSAE